ISLVGLLSGLWVLRLRPTLRLSDLVLLLGSGRLLSLCNAVQCGLADGSSQLMLLAAECCRRRQRQAWGELRAAEPRIDPALLASDGGTTRYAKTAAIDKCSL